MRRRARLVTVHPAVPPIERAALVRVLSTEPARSRVRPGLARAFQVAFVGSLSGELALRVRSRGRRLAAAGLAHGLALEGAAPLTSCRSARPALERAIKRAASAPPRHLMAGAAGVAQLRRYLYDCYANAAAAGVALGESVRALVPREDPAALDVLLRAAARAQTIEWFDRACLGLDPASTRRELEQYLAREYVAAFLLADVTPGAPVPDRTTLLARLDALPAFASALRELAMQRSLERLDRVWRGFRAERERRYLVPFVFLRQALTEGRVAAGTLAAHLVE